jgi:hypothetical protein
MVEDKKYFVRVLASLVIMLVATILMKFLVGLPTFLAVFYGVLVGAMFLDEGGVYLF